ASSGTVYLVGTSPRQQVGHPLGYGQKGVEFWKSTNSGLSFVRQPAVQEGITDSDKPWIAVDDYPGTGQHDVYITCSGIFDGLDAVWLTVSTNGYGTNWTSD